MGIEVNPTTGELELAGLDTQTADASYIKLDFSNLPTSPVTEGFAINGNTLELWWNGTLVQSFTVTPVTPDLTGQPMGLLLTLTYPA